MSRAVFSLSFIKSIISSVISEEYFSPNCVAAFSESARTFSAEKSFMCKWFIHKAFHDLLWRSNTNINNFLAGSYCI